MARLPMGKEFLYISLVALLGGGAVLMAQENGGEGPALRPHGYMKPSLEAQLRQEAALRSLPVARFPAPPADTGAASALVTAQSVLADVSTIGSARNQGSNNDCWVWASSALAEVELAHQYGYRDRISTQYVDSLVDASDFVNGGNTSLFASYVNRAGILVPWSNGNAEYIDGVVNSYCTQSLVPTSQIQTNPAYTHAQPIASVLTTQGVGQTAAIAAIQAALDNHHAVSFVFQTQFLETESAAGFDAWWANNAETVIWPEPVAGTTGMTFDPATWGGHVTTIVGYDISDADPANHYWLVLNSWGTTTTRPSGCFRVPMWMNYDSTYVRSNATLYTYWFTTLALTVDHPVAAAPTVSVPASATAVTLDQPITLEGTVVGNPPFTCQWFHNGVAIAGATSLWLKDPVPAAGDIGSYHLAVSGLNGSTVASADTQVVVDASVPQLLVNPGFETQAASSGATGTGWSFSSQGLAAAYQNPYRSGSHAHSGSGYLYLGNYGTSIVPASGQVSQTVTLPAAGIATLSCWVQMSTNETLLADIDTLALQVQDLQGNLLATLKTFTNQQTDHLNWARDAFALTPYLGQTVQICLVWRCPSSVLTIWRVDDFGLTMTNPAAAAPTVTSFSPLAGLPGTALTLTGTGFTGAEAVTFNDSPQTAFTVASDTRITTTMPAGLSAGPVMLGVLNVLGLGSPANTFAVKTLDFCGTGVDVLCMATLAGAYGSQAGDANWFAPCDLNGDGKVDDQDVTLFLANF